MSALSIASWAKSECTNRASNHGIVMRFVCLDIRSKFKLAMVVVVHHRTHDNGTRAHGVGNTTHCWETV